MIFMILHNVCWTTKGVVNMEPGAFYKKFWDIEDGDGSKMTWNSTVNCCAVLKVSQWLNELTTLT